MTPFEKFCGPCIDSQHFPAHINSFISSRLNFYLLLTFILFFISNCKNTEFPSDDLQGGELLLTDSFYLPLSAVQHFRQPCDFFYSENGKEYYSFAHDNQISIYDLTTFRLYKTISFDEEGDNGIGKLFAYAVFSEDTIIVTSRSSDKIFVTSAAGKVIQTIDLGGEIPFSVTNNQFALVGKKYLVFSIPGFIANQSKPYSAIDFKNDRIEKLNLFFPHKFRDKPVNPYFVFPNIAVNTFTQTLHILFPTSDSLYSFHIKNDKTTAQKINTFKNYNKDWNNEKYFLQQSSSMENLKHSGLIPKIKRFFHDPYRRLFVVSLSVPEPFQSSNQLIDRDIIQIYDEQFNLLQENKLDYNYSLSNAFINKNGLNVNYFLYDDKVAFHTFTYPETLKLTDGLKEVILNHSSRQNYTIVPALGCANCIEEVVRQINDSPVSDMQYILSQKLADKIKNPGNVTFVPTEWIDLIIPNPVILQTNKGVIRNYYFLFTSPGTYTSPQ